MKAHEAFKISETNLPLRVQKEYDSIIKKIEDAIKDGKTDSVLGFTMPSNDVIDLLMKDGYWFYSIGDNYLVPKMYCISCRMEQPKKKWYKKILELLKKKD